jgi:hypothetical protein
VTSAQAPPGQPGGAGATPVYRTLVCINPRCADYRVALVTTMKKLPDGTVVAFCNRCGREYRRAPESTPR